MHGCDEFKAASLRRKSSNTSLQEIGSPSLRSSQSPSATGRSPLIPRRRAFTALEPLEKAPVIESLDKAFKPLAHSSSAPKLSRVRDLSSSASFSHLPTASGSSSDERSNRSTIGGDEAFLDERFDRPRLALPQGLPGLAQLQRRKQRAVTPTSARSIENGMSSKEERIEPRPHWSTSELPPLLDTAAPILGWMGSRPPSRCCSRAASRATSSSSADCGNMGSLTPQRQQKFSRPVSRKVPSRQSQSQSHRFSTPVAETKRAVELEPPEFFERVAKKLEVECKYSKALGTDVEGERHVQPGIAWGCTPRTPSSFELHADIMGLSSPSKMSTEREIMPTLPAEVLRKHPSAESLALTPTFAEELA